MVCARQLAHVLWAAAASPASSGAAFNLVCVGPGSADRLCFPALSKRGGHAV